MTPRRLLVIEASLGLAIAAECIVNAALRGIVLAPDTRWFLQAGDDLLAHHFNVFHLYRTMSSLPPPVCYSLLPLLIAMAKAIAPASWRVLILIANAAATAGAGVLTFRLAYRTIGAIGGAVAAAGFLGGVDIIDWSRFIVTDSLFLGISTLAIYLMAVALLRDAPRYAWAAGGALLVALVTRPVAPLLLVPFAMVLIVMWRVRRRRADGATVVRRLTLGFLAAMPCILVLALAALTFIVQRQIAVPALRHVIKFFTSGAVVVGRPETWSHGGTGFGSFLETMLRRLLAFFSITAEGFSRKHAIVAALYFVPLYATAAAGIVALFSRRATRTSQEIVAYLALVTACTIWMNHALVIVDYDGATGCRSCRCC
jgi:hypothetical protein